MHLLTIPSMTRQKEHQSIETICPWLHMVSFGKVEGYLIANLQLLGAKRVVHTVYKYGKACLALSKHLASTIVTVSIIIISIVIVYHGVYTLRL